MTFEADIAAWVKKTGLKTEKVIASVCLQLSEAIIMRTPVDTGRARGNWIATINDVSTEIDRPADKVGTVALLRAKKRSGEAAGNIFYLTNSLPYIQVLEYGQYGTGPGATIKTTRDGYSVQAPSGMVRISVQQLQQALSNAIR